MILMLQQAVAPPASPIPFWVPTLLSLCAILVNVVMFWRNYRRTEKRLTYEYSTARISSVSSHPFSERLKILFDDQLVPRAALVTITVKNIGAPYIQKTDFGSDIQFKFEGHDTKVLTAEVSTKLKDVPVINWGSDVGDGSEITVSPILLNSRAEFSIMALVSNGDAKISARASIAGLTRGIENKTASADASFSLRDRALVIIIAGFLLAGISFPLLHGTLSMDLPATFLILVWSLNVYLYAVQLYIRYRS